MDATAAADGSIADGAARDSVADGFDAPVFADGGSDADAAARGDGRITTPMGSGKESVAGLTIDAGGNIYLVGYFEGDLDFGDGIRSSAGDRDAFIVSYDPAGQLRWARTLGGVAEDQATGVAVDGVDVWLTGFFNDTVEFGDGPRSAVDARDAFLLRLDQDGETMATFTYGGAGNDGGSELAVPSPGRLIAVGVFGGSIDFGDGEMTTTATACTFVVELSSAGVPAWSRQFGYTGHNSARAVALDSESNIYLTGFYEGNLNFGRGPEPQGGIQDAFVLSLDSAGRYRWVQTFGASAFDWGEGIDVSATGDVFVAGFIEGTDTIDVGGATITGAGARDVFLVSYDSSGNYRWSRSFGDAGCDRARDILVNGATVIQTGLFTGSIDFGTGPITASGEDIFVARFDLSGNPLRPLQLGGDLNDEGRFLAATAAGSVFLAAEVDEDGTPCMQDSTQRDLVILQL